MGADKYAIEYLIELIGDYEKCFGCHAPYEYLEDKDLEEKIAALRVAIGTRSPIPHEEGCAQSGKRIQSSSHHEEHFRKSRLQMVREQLRRYEWPVTNRRVLHAMRKVPREAFVPESLKHFAYEDRPLPIGWGQTISQPYIVGLMTQLLDPKEKDQILEIGTGSGYQTAILAELADTVHTIEVIPGLSRRAAETLNRLGYQNIRLLEGDGSEGWPEIMDFDGILITCATPVIPEALKLQLRRHGRLIAPVGGIEGQTLTAYLKNDALKKSCTLAVRFVPMIERTYRENP